MSNFIRNKKGQRVAVHPDLSFNILQRYRIGESEKKLATELGMARTAFRQRLLKEGIIPRNRSEAMFTRMAATPPERRRKLAEAAQKARRGSRTSRVTLERRALNCQISPKINTVERVLASQIMDRGFEIIPQEAVSIYNIDIGIKVPPIAIEIFGGNWHSYGRHATRMHRRTIEILNSGRALVIVWIDALHYPLGIGATDYIITFAEELCGKKSLRCKYRVILGNGQNAPTIRSYFNDIAFIKSLGN